jgi:hypothetical protein
MTYQWGRKETAEWPSSKPLWTFTVGVVAVLMGILCAVCRYEWRWTFLQQHYFGTYIASQVNLWRQKTNCSLLFRVDGGQERPANNEDVTDPEELNDSSKFQWKPAAYDNHDLNDWLRLGIYDGSPWQMLWSPAWKATAAVFLWFLPITVPKDLQRKRIRREGRRLKGPELVTASEFNYRNQSDGIGFFNQQRTLAEKIFRTGKMVRIPRDREAAHAAIMGDQGVGKSTATRHIGIQIERRDETAIIYDPALEYTPQFYRPERGDVILNVEDARCPHWPPAEELKHDAEALTIAASLFPDSEHEKNQFFMRGPRRIFAHLLKQRPTLEQLIEWLSDERELDKRIQGTELAGLLYQSAGPQRGGLFGELSMVADILKLIPRQNETKARWTATEWAKHRQGWIFLTSTPELREPLAPLISLWIDLLVLRTMNQGRPGVRPVWFILDELATLQKLPQLHTAIRENRKSGNPVILGFQGRSQVEARYGHEAEAMLSQPATKIFLRTSEPRAADWISRTIGYQEIERLRETRTHGERHTYSETTEYVTEPLVMDSEITGLPNLHGYLKSGNLVVRLRLPYINLPNREPAFIERARRPEPRLLRQAPDQPLLNMPPPFLPESEPESTKPAPEAARKPQPPTQGPQERPFYE